MRLGVGYAIHRLKTAVRICCALACGTAAVWAGEPQPDYQSLYKKYDSKDYVQVESSPPAKKFLFDLLKPNRPAAQQPMAADQLDLLKPNRPAPSQPVAADQIRHLPSTAPSVPRGSAETQAEFTPDSDSNKNEAAGREAAPVSFDSLLPGPPLLLSEADKNQATTSPRAVPQVPVVDGLNTTPKFAPPVPSKTTQATNPATPNAAPRFTFAPAPPSFPVMTESSGSASRESSLFGPDPTESASKKAATRIETKAAAGPPANNASAAAITQTTVAPVAALPGNFPSPPSPVGVQDLAQGSVAAGLPTAPASPPVAASSEEHYAGWRIKEAAPQSPANAPLQQVGNGSASANRTGQIKPSHHRLVQGVLPFQKLAQVPPAADPFLDDPLAERDPHEPTPFEVLGPTGEMTITARRNKVLRCRADLLRVAVVDETICDLVQFTPREVSIIGRSVGTTHITFWFADGDQRPITYLVRVVPDPEIQIEREREYQILEEVLLELFPDSKVYLIPVADKLIVRGQAKDGEEAAQILAIIRGQFGNQFGGRRGGGIVSGRAASPLGPSGGTNGGAVVNMLRIPGVQQVALKAKIAELNRSAARNTGLNLDASVNLTDGTILLQTLLNATTTTSLIGNFDDFSLDLGLSWLRSQGVIRVLSEPTLVTMSGETASFTAGGQFAVPTTVGVGGVGAITTSFRSFGVLLSFTPTVLDKDRIRLIISPEFSQIDAGLSVGGTPGLSTRSVTTTVEMREGQVLAIAGLLEDTMKSSTVSDLPFLPRFLNKREVSRNETELIILVTPELVHPMEPEEVPPLPGFDITEPTDHEFYLGGRIEGIPTHEHRSTIWPRLRRRYRTGAPEMISGPFGHGQ